MSASAWFALWATVCAVVSVAAAIVARRAHRDTAKAAAFTYAEVESYYTNRDVASGRALVECAALVDTSEAGDRSDVVACGLIAGPCPFAREPWRIVGERCGLGDGGARGA